VPNALHAEFAIRAARAGKHVLVEKPMALSVAQCEAMTAASAAAGKYLAVAYRVQFDPRHLEMQRLAREQVFGMPKLMRADIGFPLRRDDWRLSNDLSGGVLMEQGVYAVNAACSLTGEEPLEVVAHQAKSDLVRFANVEESVFWSMQYPSGAVAQCATSYTVRMNGLRVDAVEGYFELEPAYSSDGLRGSSTAGAIGGGSVNQIALQLDDFAACIQNGVAPVRGSAAEGLRDVRILVAIRESLRSGRSVSVA
jgi:predicted dehydrogenase